MTNRSFSSRSTFIGEHPPTHPNDNDNDIRRETNEEIFDSNEDCEDKIKEDDDDHDQNDELLFHGWKKLPACTDIHTMTMNGLQQKSNEWNVWMTFQTAKQDYQPQLRSSSMTTITTKNALSNGKTIGIDVCFPTHKHERHQQASVNSKSDHLHHQLNNSETVDTTIGLPMVTTFSLYQKPSSACSKYDNLSTITLPPTLQEIGDDVFANCQNLQQITIPTTIRKIGKRAFANCYKLTYVTIPHNAWIDIIDEEAFYACYHLQTIVLPNSLQVISYRSFGSCYDLVKVHFPKDAASSTSSPSSSSSSLRVIGSRAFSRCPKLKTIQLPSKRCSLVEIGSFAFGGCRNMTGQLDLPNSIERIGECAFIGCKGLEGIKLPDTMERIEEKTFAGCTNLTTVELPSTLVEVGSGAFEYCSSLTSIQLPCRIRHIGSRIFVGCSKLQTINVPTSIEMIEKYAFGGCLAFLDMKKTASGTSISNDDDMPATDVLHYICDLNRAGKSRFLQRTQRRQGEKELIYSSSLWPIIMYRIMNQMKFPKHTIIIHGRHRKKKEEGKETDNDEDNDCRRTRGTKNKQSYIDNESIRCASVIFSLVLSGVAMEY